MLRTDLQATEREANTNGRQHEKILRRVHHSAPQSPGHDPARICRQAVRHRQRGQQVGARHELPRHNPHTRHLRDPGRERARAAHGQRGRGGALGGKARRALPPHGAQLQARAVHRLRRHGADLRNMRPRRRRRAQLVAGGDGGAAVRRQPDAAARAGARAPWRTVERGGLHRLAAAALRRHMPGVRL